MVVHRLLAGRHQPNASERGSASSTVPFLALLCSSMKASLHKQLGMMLLCPAFHLGLSSQHLDVHMKRWCDEVGTVSQTSFI